MTNESFGAGGKELPYPTIADFGQGTNWQKKFFKKHRYQIMILALEEVEISRLTRLDFQLLIRRNCRRKKLALSDSQEE